MKPHKGIAMEGPIAAWYARNTRGEMRDYRRWAQRVADSVPPGGAVLEVAPGPGYLALELAKLGHLAITGLDSSKSFVRIARANARAAGADVDFQLGDAAHLPFPDDRFDFVICRAAFKNFSDPAGALAEVHRVLAPGGTGVIDDLRRDAPREAVEAEIASMGLSPLNRWLVRWTFKNMLLKRAYGDAELRAMCARLPGGAWEIAENGIGFELRLSKRAR